MHDCICHSVSRLFVINSALVSSVSDHQPDMIFLKQLTSFFPLKMILQSTTLSLNMDAHSRQNQSVSWPISKVISKIRCMHFWFPGVLQVPKFDSTLIVHLKPIFALCGLWKKFKFFKRMLCASNASLLIVHKGPGTTYVTKINEF